MSIHDEINRLVADGLLLHLAPAIPYARCVRVMFVSREIASLLDGPWQSRDFEIRAGRLRADLDAFTEGRILAVATHPYKKPKWAYMAQIDPPADEVWDIRSRDPKPGLRVFGRFAEKDVFVALLWRRREDMGGRESKEWRDSRESCKAEWRKLFLSYPAFSGDDNHDYLSNIILV